MSFLLLTDGATTIHVAAVEPHAPAAARRALALLQAFAPPTVFLDLDASVTGQGFFHDAELRAAGPGASLLAPFVAARAWCQETGASCELLAAAWRPPRLGWLARRRLRRLAENGRGSFTDRAASLSPEAAAAFAARRALVAQALAGARRGGRGGVALLRADTADAIVELARARLRANP